MKTANIETIDASPHHSKPLPGPCQPAQENASGRSAESRTISAKKIHP